MLDHSVKMQKTVIINLTIIDQIKINLLLNYLMTLDQKDIQKVTYDMNKVNLTIKEFVELILIKI